jgi:hypothetical protein
MNNSTGGYGINGPIDYIFRESCTSNKEKYENRNKYFWEYSSKDNEFVKDRKLFKIILLCFILLLIGSLIPTLVKKFQNAKNNGAALGLFIPTIILLFFFVVAFFLKCGSTRRTWMILYGFSSFFCMFLLLFIDPITNTSYKYTTEELMKTIISFIFISGLMVVAIKYN